MNDLNKKTINNGFDRNIDFNNIDLALVKNIKSTFVEVKKNNSIQKVKALSNLIVSLIQLRNGSRISEAIEATEIFLNDLDTKIAVIQIAKRKDNANREMYLPKEVKKEMLVYLNNYKVLDFNKKSQIQNKVRDYLNKYFDSNTHSLRYATIDKLVNDGTPLNIVSKVVGHKNLNQIISYTQNKNVKNVLLNLQNNKK